MATVRVTLEPLVHTIAVTDYVTIILAIYHVGSVTIVTRENHHVLRIDFKCLEDAQQFVRTHHGVEHHGVNLVARILGDDAITTASASSPSQDADPVSGPSVVKPMPIMALLVPHKTSSPVRLVNAILNALEPRLGHMNALSITNRHGVQIDVHPHRGLRSYLAGSFSACGTNIQKCRAVAEERLGSVVQAVPQAFPELQRRTH